MSDLQVVEAAVLTAGPLHGTTRWLFTIHDDLFHTRNRFLEYLSEWVKSRLAAAKSFSMVTMMALEPTTPLAT